MKYRAKVVVFDWVETILRTDLPSNAKYIALYLRTFMNAKSDMAWPSLKRIEHETGLGHATVLKYLAILDSEGWLERNRGSKGVNTRYVACIPEEVGREPTYGRSRADLGVGREPTPNKQVNKQVNTPLPQMERFEMEFWPTYPRKEGKKDAVKAWLGLSGKDMDAAIVGLHARTWPKEKKYIMLPATYLRGERWTDEPEQSQSSEVSYW